jgi:hypothetical integral membrane protein (TIGR02206 family)
VRAARLLAVVIVVNEAAWWVWLGVHHTYSVSYALPLQLCDVAAVFTALALWLRTQLLVEIAYFWGVAGTANGLITPDVSDHFPSFLFIQYFVQHGAIVGAALFLVIGLRIEPRRWAWLQVFGFTVVLMVVDAFANLLTGGNYLYLRQTPGVKSILNLMGPWPWYIVGAAVVALVLLFVLDLPFRIAGRERARSRTSPYPPPASPPSPQPRPGR